MKKGKSEITESKTTQTKNTIEDNGVRYSIVMGDLYDDAGKIVTVVLKHNPSSHKGNELDLIKISSSQGRSHIESLFKYESGKLVAVRFVDKNRIQDWLNANRLQLPLHSFNLDSTKTISQPDDSVNTQDNGVRYSAKEEVLKWDINGDSNNFSSIKDRLIANLHLIKDKPVVAEVKYYNANKKILEVELKKLIKKLGKLFTQVTTEQLILEIKV